MPSERYIAEHVIHTCTKLSWTSSIVLLPRSEYYKIFFFLQKCENIPSQGRKHAYFLTRFYF